MIGSERRLFSFLDLMLGFVGAMYLLIAAAAANVGEHEVREAEMYLLIELDLADVTGATWAPPPRAAVFEALQPLPPTFELHCSPVPVDPVCMRYVVHASRIDSLGNAADPAQVAAKLRVAVRAEALGTLSIVGARLQGELSPGVLTIPGTGTAVWDTTRLQDFVSALARVRPTCTKLPIEFELQ